MKIPAIALCLLGSLFISDQADAAPLLLTLSVETVYQDGEKSIEQRTESYEAMEDFFAAYKDWQIIDMNNELITLRTTEDTVSPLMKWSGYTSVD
ncbi:BofC N-terminal domain-containing protein [Jeotgalibacillus sp. JSM ZJ347]|uniref:BofC N-terminal domain-containing protein n=1 Tax=Jeotgalibacillus sp. JSM ZJ347 TaxID=3342117 RepID=UPI0035A8235B